MNRILAEITDIQKCLGHGGELHKEARLTDMFTGPDLRRTMITFWNVPLAKQQQASSS